MITWVLYLCIGIIVGGMAGFYFAKLDDFSKKQKKELEEKLQKSEHELLDYKDQVTTHFKETAALINNMTESYQKVHEHLARGSVELCNNAIEVNKLTVSSNQLLSSTSEPAPENVALDAEKATSLTESEAPKESSTENNNNNEQHTEVVDVKPEVRESVAESDASRQEALAPNSNNPQSEPVENPVLETMAVAEEESSDSTESESTENSEPRLPGSRMVH